MKISSPGSPSQGPWRWFGLDVLEVWATREPDVEVRRRVMTWMTRATYGPDEVAAVPVPGYDEDVFASFVPDTDVAVTWVVDESDQSLGLVTVETVGQL